MTVLRWETPPPKDGDVLRSWAVAVASELASRPGQWAVVGEYAQPIDTSTPMFRLYNQPDIWCEHTVDPATGRTTLYACWSRKKPEKP